MATILLVSHTNRHSGFGRIAVGIAGALAAENEVHVIGIGIAQESETWIGHEHNTLDIACTTALRTWARETPPEVIILIGVSMLLAWQSARLRRDGFTGILVAYVPVEGPVWAPDRLEGLRACTMVVAYHQTGKNILAAALGPGTPIHSIYHGVDNSIPKLGSRKEIRSTLFPTLEAHFNRTWILNANRNDDRKCPELTLQAFAEISALVPESTLVLHCDLQRPGVNLQFERARLGLTNQVLFTHELIAGFWSDEQLCQLYQCCEIGVNSALGEGWGLIAFEHALQGGAQILPAHAGLVEIWGNAPVWIPLDGARPIDHVYTGHKPKADDFASLLLNLVQNSLQTLFIADACNLHVKKEEFCWDTISIQWRSLVSRLLSKETL